MLRAVIIKAAGVQIPKRIQIVQIGVIRAGLLVILITITIEAIALCSITIIVHGAPIGHLVAIVVSHREVAAVVAEVPVVDLQAE